MYIRQRDGVLHFRGTPCSAHSSAKASRDIHLVFITISGFPSDAHVSYLQEAKNSSAIFGKAAIHSANGPRGSVISPQYWLVGDKAAILSEQSSGGDSYVLHLSTAYIYGLRFDNTVG